jgi:hypothetical protein
MQVRSPCAEHLCSHSSLHYMYADNFAQGFQPGAFVYLEKIRQPSQMTECISPIGNHCVDVNQFEIEERER